MNDKLSNKKILELVLWVVLLGLTFGICCWTLSSDMYFLFDDPHWMFNAKFDLSHYYTILPQFRHNDRPGRDFFFSVLYAWFGMDYTYWYLVSIFIHMINVVLLGFCITKIGKQLNISETSGVVLCCCAWFALYPQNLMTVYWISGAANDSFCVLFALFSILSFLYYVERESKLEYLFLGISFISFFLALRTKEAVICLPIILLLYEAYRNFWNGKKIGIKKKGCILVAFMLVYVVRIFTLPEGITAAGQYEQEINIGVMVEILLNYIRMYFGLDDSNFGYSVGHYYTRIGNIGIAIIAAILLVCIIQIVRNKHRKEYVGILILFLCIGCAFAPFLILPNVQHLLYFYFPALFLAILFGVIVWKGISYLKGAKVVGIAVFFLLLVLCSSAPGPKGLRNLWIMWGKEANSAAGDLQDIQIAPGTNVYVKGASEGVNIFNYGGFFVNLLNNDSELKTFLIDETTVLEEPYIILNYEEGDVTVEQDKSSLH